jgi:periplasmic protein TonB
MKKIFFAIVISFCAVLNVQAQNNTKTIDSSKSDDYIKVEVEASFPGGLKEWKKYLEKNLRAQTPSNNNAKPGSYKVVVQFIVDKDGTISNVTALTNFGYGMENEVKRVIQNGPNWIPATQNGKAVKAYRKQPITFVIPNEK